MDIWHALDDIENLKIVLKDTAAPINEIRRSAYWSDSRDPDTWGLLKLNAKFPNKECGTPLLLHAAVRSIPTFGRSMSPTSYALQLLRDTAREYCRFYLRDVRCDFVELDTLLLDVERYKTLWTLRLTPSGFPEVLPCSDETEDPTLAKCMDFDLFLEFACCKPPALAPYVPPWIESEPI